MDDGRYEIIPLDFEDKQAETHALALLREVFGRDYFTPEWWKWKYLDNPFGKPLGWCVRDRQTGEFLAVRVAWRWRLAKGEERRTAWEMIDTATSSRCRGMGFFKTLTCRFLDTVGDDWIFNFPNQNSAPLNRRLGWLNEPWVFRSSTPTPRWGYEQGSMDNLQPEELEPYARKECDRWHTDWSGAFLKWRFSGHPRFRYYYFFYSGEAIIYKIEKKNALWVATVMYVRTTSRAIYAAFSGYLFFHGIAGYRYNACNDPDYDYLAKRWNSLSFRKTFNYFLRNCSGEELSLCTGDTDFL